MKKGHTHFVFAYSYRHLEHSTDTQMASLCHTLDWILSHLWAVSDKSMCKMNPPLVTSRILSARESSVTLNIQHSGWSYSPAIHSRSGVRKLEWFPLRFARSLSLPDFCSRKLKARFHFSCHQTLSYRVYKKETSTLTQKMIHLFWF